VPGHILHAECCCGFSRELAPGYNERRNIGYTVAYSADESDLVTEDDAVIKLAGLRTIRDPCLSDYGQGDTEKVGQGLHLCPRCKKTSLMLHFRGCWD
jgi:hypothetical protein